MAHYNAVAMAEVDEVCERLLAAADLESVDKSKIFGANAVALLKL